MEHEHGLYSFYHDEDISKIHFDDPRLHLSIYDTRLKVVDGGWVEVRKYNKPIVSLKGFEEEERESIIDIQFGDKFVEKKGRVSKGELYRTIARSSLARTRQMLIEYVTGNADYWKTFITLTFADESMNDISECNKLFHKFRTSLSRACKRNGFELAYIGIPEFQKNGRVHYHLLTNLELDTELVHKQKNNEKYYDVKYWSYGFSSAFDVVRNTDDKFNAALYMIKYLYKDFDERLYGSTRLLKSNNLKAPTTIKLLADSQMYVDALAYLKEHGYGITEHYDLERDIDKPFMVPSSTDIYEPINTGHVDSTNFKEYFQELKELEF